MVINMNDMERIIKIAETNNKIVTSKMMDMEGISREMLSYLVRNELLIKYDIGVYMLPDCIEDEYFSKQYRFKKGVYSYLSALYLLGYSDVIPLKLHMTFPLPYCIKSAKESEIVCYREKEEKYKLGIIKVKDFLGNEVVCYSIEKTLCDIVKKKSSIDIRIIADAFKKYAKDKHKNLPLLYRYAKELKVVEDIRRYMEVLL